MATTGQIYFNRELGWVKFNKRVLAQAEDPRTPLLERVRFLSIFQSNLDEFFMKRVGGLKRQHYSRLQSVSMDGLSPSEQLQLIHQKVTELQAQVDDLVEKQLLPALNGEKIQLLEWNDLSSEEQRWAQTFFRDKIFPVLTPMAVDPGHPFPLISNLSTSLAVALQHEGESERLFARIKLPDVFPTWIRIPDRPAGEDRFISLRAIVQEHLTDLFPRMTILSVMAFRITRNIDLELSDDEGVEDLLESIEEEVRQRRFAEVVRLEHGPDLDPWLLEFLIDELELEPEDIFALPMALEWRELSSLFELSRPQLKFIPWNPVTLPPLNDESQNIFNLVRQGDLFIHLPYESFSTSVERFIQTASTDPHVVAIKMTLYRTSSQSSIVQALIRAAEEGKQVVCLIELKARLDEERNIYWAQAMEKAGVHVVYGIVGLKTHAKISLVVRKEKDEFRTYAHIGTGNYHSQTAKVYTDMGLMTCQPEITSELVEVFHFLTGRSLKSDYQRLLVAPVNMKSRFLDLIRSEAENARANKPSGIVAKMNNLQDREIIDALYEASSAGVAIELIVRGFSCLRPEMPGVSDNIRVISIIGPLLEHSRFFYFRNGAIEPVDGLFYIGSADWMSRNLNGRVEVCTPLLDIQSRQKVWEAMQLMLKDSCLAWRMDADGRYHRTGDPSTELALGSQQQLMALAKSRATREANAPS